MKILDAMGDAVDYAGEEVLAELEISPSLKIVYRREPEQIGLLIEGLRRAGAQNPALLDAQYWTTTKCAKRGGFCGGSCPRGMECRNEPVGPYFICQCWDKR